ncbi:ankyrin repeat domain-containing protein [Actinoplanes sp. CA-131856]
MEPAVITAARDGNLSALRPLLGAVDARGWMGETALHAAAAAGSAGAVRMLLGAGASARARRDNGDTPLHRAATGEIAALLIKAARDVTPDQHNEHGQTPLHCARDREVTEVLLRWGASLSERDFFGRTPLHDADAAKARTLLDAGAQIDARDGFGRTPLHRAVANSDAALVELLLTEGADPVVRDESGRSPLHLARQLGLQPLAASGATLAEARAVAQRALRPARDPGVAFSVAGHATLVRWRLGPAPHPEATVPTEHVAFRDLAVHDSGHNGRPLVAVAPVEAPAELRGPDLTGPEPLDGLGDVTALAFSPDGRRLAAATSDERVVLYDLATRRVTADVEAGERNDCVAFSPDGALLATTCSFQGGAHVRLDRVTAEGGLEPVTEIEPLAGDTIPAAVFAPDGRHLLIWTTSGVTDGRRAAGWRGELSLTALDGHPVWQHAIDATATGVRAPLTGWSTRPCFTPDGETIALALDGVVVLLATGDGRTLAALPLDGRSGAVVPDGPSRLVVATDRGLRVVELPTN